MAVSDVYGLSRFREHMAGLEGAYAVIGGTACDILLRDADIAFRATKDIDVVLVADERLPEMGRAVWQMVRDGGYTCGWRSSDEAHFWRFTDPAEPGYPSMIGLFSRSPEFVDDTGDLTVVPLPIDEGISSLSAILLDESYYLFMREGRMAVDGVTVLDPEHLVPFKARAYVDLSARRAAGEHVNTRDLRKHKKDVFRLMQLFVPGTRVELPDQIRDDMREFVSMAEREGVPLAQMGVLMTLGEGLNLLRDTYGL